MNGNEHLGRWARLRRWIRDRRLPKGFDLAPEPRATRLNRRVFLVVGIVVIGVIWAAVATLVDADRARRQARVEVAMVASSAPDPFWKGEPDGVAFPDRGASPAEEPGPDEAADAPIATLIAANSLSTLMNSQGASAPSFTSSPSASTMCVCGEIG